MITWQIFKGEVEYQCPYCGCEIINYSDEVENRIEYCSRCGREFEIEVIDK